MDVKFSLSFYFCERILVDIKVCRSKAVEISTSSDGNCLQDYKESPFSLFRGVMQIHNSEM
jgi:hypothetical protein